ncbi:MAG: RNA 2',3'-cyclic phosphodiesterase [Candidatus Aenigmatarchaeota archaeon]
MRLFISLEVPEDIRKNIIIAKDKLGINGKIKWVPIGNIHITIKFLGGVQDGLLEDIKAKIRNAAKDTVPFDVSVRGIGTFGRPPRVVWAGIDRGKIQLIDLMKKMDASLSCIRQEDFKPSPHITIGRIRSSEPGSMPLQPFEKEMFGEFVADSVHLMESTLSKDGPSYSCMETFRFGANES